MDSKPGMPYASKGGNDQFRGNMGGKMPKEMGHASKVYDVPTMTAGYGDAKIKKYNQGSRGYSAQAWDYQW